MRPQTETTYRVRVADGYVYAVDYAKVIVTPAPFTITGESIVCATEEYLEYDANSSQDCSYSWTAADGNIISGGNESQVQVDWGTTPGKRALRVLVTDNNTGCADSKIYEVEILPAPPEPVIMLKGDHLLICPDSGRIYQWYQNYAALPGANKQFYYALSDNSGIFTVETRLKENQCIKISDPFSFSKKSTRESGPELQTVFIRPNPGNGHIIMDIINDYTGQINITITNSMGAIVKQQTLHKRDPVYETVINLRALASGSYFIIIEYGFDKEVHQIIIQH